jgi:hypothetical protein
VEKRDGVKLEAMSQCTIVDVPVIEDDFVVVRVVHRDPAKEDVGRVFICKMRSFDELILDTLPEGLAPHVEGEYRAEAAEAARAYAAENLGTFEELFEELSRREARET